MKIMVLQTRGICWLSLWVDRVRSEHQTHCIIREVKVDGGICDKRLNANEDLVIKDIKNCINVTEIKEF